MRTLLSDLCAVILQYDGAVVRNTANAVTAAEY